MSPADGGRPAKVPVWQAIALGVVHGPAELLPISSSGHVGAIPFLLGWSYSDVDGTQRKSFEVALHAGTAAGLALGRRGELVALLEARALSLSLAASALPALIGFAFESRIEAGLGTPHAIAAGLAAGSVAMAIADQAPQSRRFEQAGLNDALWLGVAQAAALAPGVSRHGATLTAARLRGFRRPDAHRLSDLVGLAPILGASALRTLRQRGRLDVALIAGAGAAFASTLTSERLLRGRRRDGALWPFAAYRLGLAAAIIRQLR